VEEAAMESEQMVSRLEQIFAKCDRNNRKMVSKIDLIKTLREAPDVAAFFRLPAVIRQEDGSRDLFEAIFQKIDKSGDRVITWPEFERYFAAEVAEAPRRRRTIINQMRRRSSKVQP
jgi:Ca2+-binding EF-hand superfamily protein